jgi:hypothetical protein
MIDYFSWPRRRSTIHYGQDKNEYCRRKPYRASDSHPAVRHFGKFRPNQGGIAEAVLSAIGRPAGHGLT